MQMPERLCKVDSKTGCHLHHKQLAVSYSCTGPRKLQKASCWITLQEQVLVASTALFGPHQVEHVAGAGSVNKGDRRAAGGGQVAGHLNQEHGSRVILGIQGQRPHQSCGTACNTMKVRHGQNALPLTSTR